MHSPFGTGFPVPPTSVQPSPLEGAELGAADGEPLGVDVGALVGRAVGALVGRAVGALVGVDVGALVGRAVGAFVGVGRGVGVGVATDDTLALATAVDVAVTVGGRGATSGVATGSGSFLPMWMAHPPMHAIASNHPNVDPPPILPDPGVMARNLSRGPMIRSRARPS
ncbi:MAG: hypothetical protein U0414_36705 [Polyangiaceae bacterium]